MGWGDTSLSGLLGHQEEIKAFVFQLVLDKVGVNDATWLWVLHAPIATLKEHSLVDPLVNHNESDFDWLCQLVVKRLESFFELSDLLVEDLVSHLLTYTVPVDDDLSWKLVLVVLSEVPTRIHQAPV